MREAQRDPEVEVFIYGERRMTFFQLRERACRLANALSSFWMGIRLVSEGVTYRPQLGRAGMIKQDEGI